MNCKICNSLLTIQHSPFGIGCVRLDHEFYYNEPISQNIVLYDDNIKYIIHILYNLNRGYIYLFVGKDTPRKLSIAKHFKYLIEFKSYDKTYLLNKINNILMLG